MEAFADHGGDGEEKAGFLFRAHNRGAIVGSKTGECWAPNLASTGSLPKPDINPLH